MTLTVAEAERPALSADEHGRLLRAVIDMGLVPPNAEPSMEMLSGGVSSLIVRMEWNGVVFCVKSALGKLAVAEDWRVPVDRNRSEVLWLREAGRLVPGSAPQVLGDDGTRNVFAMEWFEPASFPVWKAELLAGHASRDFARATGAALGRIHAGTANRPDIARSFATDANFHALRIEPYFVFTARQHCAVADVLLELARRTAVTKRALVHGDISPKNILRADGEPVFLDAECAWYGDPAFDLAFCLNHLLLKACHLRASSQDLLACARAFHDAYCERVDWEPRVSLEERATTLIPGLALARIDGKSPVEYLTLLDRERVQQIALRLLRDPPRAFASLEAAWMEGLQ